MMNENSFEDYLKYIADVDKTSDALFALHKNHVKCAKGCSSCCMAFNLFPVEYYYLKSKIDVSESEKLQQGERTEAECNFLNDKSTCAIYNHRPLICRTHGLPMLSMGDESWELSFCDLNFTSVSDDFFVEENTFPQDKYNSKLFLLNRQFLADNKHLKHSEFDMIPMNELSNNKDK